MQYKSLWANIPADEAFLFGLDADECLGRHNCSKNAACKNTHGSYSCTCKSGYHGNGLTCQDNDECETKSRCHANATCTNSAGSYSCGCNAGFTGNGSFCQNVDECGLNLQNCPSYSVCVDLPGSYSCSCHVGFLKVNGSCIDEDECEAPLPACDPDSGKGLLICDFMHQHCHTQLHRCRFL